MNFAKPLTIIQKSGKPKYSGNYFIGIDEKLANFLVTSVKIRQTFLSLPINGKLFQR